MTERQTRRTVVEAVSLTPSHESFIKSGVPLGGRSAISQEDAANQEPDDRFSEMLVPITTKLRRRTYQALRRAYLQQKLRHRLPATQQEIVEAAVSDWLKTHGFQND